MSNNLDIFKIQTNNIAPKKGRMLIAEPFFAGDYFTRSLVFLVAFSEKGAVGFILNKKANTPLQKIFPNFPDFNAQVYLGGPVATDSIYFIHKLGDKLSGSIHVMDDLYWGGDFEMLKRDINLGKVNPSDIRFFLGYSGWDAGQLENELKRDSWLVADIDTNDVMQEQSENSWMKFARRVGERYSVWENFPEDPSLN